MAGDREVKVAILGDSKGLTDALEVAGGKLGGFGEKLGSIGVMMTAAFAVGAVGAVIGLESIGASFDSAFDNIRIKTGQTGAVLEGLQGSFKNVLGQVPASMDTVATAIAGVNQKLGLTGAPLEALTTQFVNLSRLTKTDLSGNLEAVTSLFNNFGVAAEDQGPKLDELFRISQHTGVSVSDLATQMAGAGVVLRNAGLSFDESGALLGLLAKNGLSASDAMPALSKAMAHAAKEGKPAQQVIQDTFTAIQNAPNDTKAAGVALDVFGAKAGPKLATLIREGKLSYDEFIAAVNAGGDTINGAASATDDWREKLDILKNKVLVALEPVASAVFDGFTRAIVWLTDTGMPALATAFGAIRDVVVTVIDAIVGGFQNPDAAINFGGWEAVAINIGQVFHRAADIIVGAFDAVKSWFEAKWPAIQAVFDTVWADIQDGVQTAATAVTVAFGAIVDWFKANWSTISDVFNTVWGDVEAGFSWLLDHKEVLIAALAVLTVSTVAYYETVAAAAATATAAETAAAAPTLIAIAPFVAAAAAVAALAAAAVYAYNNFKGFRNVVDGVVTWMKTTLIPIFQATYAWIVDNTQKLVDYISERWEAIKGAVTTIITALVVEISVVLAPLIFIWTNAHDQIMAVVNIVWLNIQLVVGTAMRIIKDIIDVVLGLLSGDWGMAWDAIKDIPLAAFEYMKGTVQLGIDAVRAILEAALVLLQALWSLAWGTIEGVLAGAWDAIKGAASSGVDNVVSFFEGLPGRAASALSSLGGILLKIGQDAMNSMWDAITTEGGNILSWFGDLPGKMIDAIGDVGSLLYNIGRQILQSLIDGAKSILGDVQSFFSGIASDIVGWKGPPEHDKTVLVPAGENLMKGLVSGAQGQMSDVKSFFTGVAPDIRSGIGAGSGGGGGSTTFNLTVNAGMGADGQSIATIIINELKAWTRSNGALPLPVR